MKDYDSIPILLFLIGCTAAYPVNNSDEDTAPNDENDGSIWTSWYMIVINVIVPITMVVSVACCCCCGSSKTQNESSLNDSGTRDKNDTTKGIEMERRNQMTKSGTVQKLLAFLVFS